MNRCSINWNFSTLTKSWEAEIVYIWTLWIHRNTSVRLPVQRFNIFYSEFTPRIVIGILINCGQNWHFLSAFSSKETNNISSIGNKPPFESGPWESICNTPYSPRSTRIDASFNFAWYFRWHCRKEKNVVLNLGSVHATIWIQYRVLCTFSKIIYEWKNSNHNGSVNSDSRNDGGQNSRDIYFWIGGGGTQWACQMEGRKHIGLISGEKWRALF